MLLEAPPFICTSDLLFAAQWPDHFWNAGAASDMCIDTLNKVTIKYNMVWQAIEWMNCVYMKQPWVWKAKIQTRKPKNKVTI